MPPADMPSRRAAPPPLEGEPAPVRRRPRGAPAEYEEDAWDEDFEPEENRGGRPRKRGRTLASVSNEYRIDIGEWFNYAKDHYTSILGPFIGYWFLLALIYLAALIIPFINILGAIALLVWALWPAGQRPSAAVVAPLPPRLPIRQSPAEPPRGGDPLPIRQSPDQAPSEVKPPHAIPAGEEDGGSGG